MSVVVLSVSVYLLAGEVHPGGWQLWGARLCDLTDPRDHGRLPGTQQLQRGPRGGQRPQLSPRLQTRTHLWGQSVSQSVSQSGTQSDSQAGRQAVSHSRQSFSQAINQSVSQESHSVRQTVSQVSQSVSQSVSQLKHFHPGPSAPRLSGVNLWPFRRKVMVLL